MHGIYMGLFSPYRVEEEGGDGSYGCAPITKVSVSAIDAMVP